ncbi:MAG: hypothetical protein PHW31_04080 [Candidatus Pacebacteria bacterium]|nr:hypothetical protein [Candidatus Paceibacterota bacterium]
MSSKILIVIIIILVVIIAGGVYYFLNQKSSQTSEVNNQPVSGQEVAGGAGAGEEPLSEQPNKAKFDEYLTGAYLAKLPSGVPFSPWAVEKTKIFVSSDQFCTSMDIKKDIATGTLATAVYDGATKQDVQPKSVFPMLIRKGNTIGCEPLSYSAGKYEFKIYLDNVLAVVLPFEVK